jgi:dTDP-4-amino-4,6-dideoxygalactose transaminase
MEPSIQRDERITLSPMMNTAVTPSTSNHYPLATSSWGDEELNAMRRVMETGMFTMGKEVRAFEEAFATYVGSRYAVMVNSGSSANLLMISAMRYRKEGSSLQPGDEVIVPAVSWSTTYYPLYQYGLKLVFVDVNPDTLNMDATAVANAITPNTCAILAVNLLGNPNDFNTLNALCDAHNLVLLEDNCESLGATFNGKQAGTYGLMGTYSSFFSHHISTMEGGLIVTDDEELYHILLCIRSHGWTRHLPQENKITGTKSPNAFDEAFKFVLPGYNVRPLELEGAIGLEQLKKLPAFIEARQQNATLFTTLFANQTTFRIQQEVGNSSWFGFSLILTEEAVQRGICRQQVVEVLEAANIDVRPIVTGNFAKNPVLQHFDCRVEGDLPHANWLDEHGLFVGNHQFDIAPQLHHLHQTLSSFIQG